MKTTTSFLSVTQSLPSQRCLSTRMHLTNQKLPSNTALTFFSTRPCSKGTSSMPIELIPSLRCADLQPPVPSLLRLSALKAR